MLMFGPPRSSASLHIAAADKLSSNEMRYRLRSHMALSLSRKHATKRTDVDWLMSCLAFWPSCGTKRSLWRLKLGLVLRLRVRRWVVDVVVYSAPYSLRGEIGSLICAGVRNLSAMGVSSVGVLSWTPMVAS